MIITELSAEQIKQEQYFVTAAKHCGCSAETLSTLLHRGVDVSPQAHASYSKDTTIIAEVQLWFEKSSLILITPNFNISAKFTATQFNPCCDWLFKNATSINAQNIDVKLSELGELCLRANIIEGDE